LKSNSANSVGKAERSGKVSNHCRSI